MDESLDYLVEQGYDFPVQVIERRMAAGRRALVAAMPPDVRAIGETIPSGEPMTGRERAALLRYRRRAGRGSTFKLVAS